MRQPATADDDLRLFLRKADTALLAIKTSTAAARPSRGKASFTARMASRGAFQATRTRRAPAAVLFGGNRTTGRPEPNTRGLPEAGGWGIGPGLHGPPTTTETAEPPRRAPP